MKKKVICFLLALVVTGLLSADVKEDFTSLVDFSVTFRKLYQEAQTSGIRQFLGDRLIIIDGSVASRLVLNDEEESFLAELELINGDWIGLEDVAVYKCYVQLKGPEFSSRIPARRSRNKLPDEIELNSRVLIVGRVVDSRRGSDGSVLPVVEALFVRPL